MTAFSILGASGEAYHKGIGVFALMGSASALIIPSIFFFVGTRLWAIGKRHGYLTQVQYIRERWNSDSLGLLLFVILVALVVPYLLIGVMGGGQTLAVITGGQVPKMGRRIACLRRGCYLRLFWRDARHRVGEHASNTGIYDLGCGDLFYNCWARWAVCRTPWRGLTEIC